MGSDVPDDRAADAGSGGLAQGGSPGPTGEFRQPETAAPDAQTRIRELARRAVALARAARAAAAAEKLAGDVGQTGARLQKAVGKAARELGACSGTDAALDAVRDLLKRWEVAAEEFRRRAHTAVPSALAARLAPAGIELEGVLPELRAGLWTLRFLLDAKKPRVEVWFGPRVALAKSFPADVGQVALGVESLNRSLAGRPLDEDAFLEDLRAAHRMARLRKGLPDDGSPAPLPDVMAEMAFERQDRRFRTNPARESFRAYGRAEFGFDLFRLRKRDFRGEAVRLGVASREQTRRPEHHLWVPSDLRGKGTHYADLSFRRAE